MQVKPFTKWVGGKTQILATILKNFPKNINNYFEPFVGGGSVLIALLQQLDVKNITVNNINVSDINYGLITCYQQIKTNVNNLIARLKILKEEYINAPTLKLGKREKVRTTSLDDALKKGKPYLYYYYRDVYNYLIYKEDKSDTDKLEIASLFIYLNKTSWRGIYRENSLGKFNVPFGNYENLDIYDEDNIKNLHDLFNKYNVNFENDNFDAFIGDVKLNDFVYIDPPYAAINESSFVSYNSGGFGKKENERLYVISMMIVKSGGSFLLSNAYVPYIIERYKEYKQCKIVCKRHIHVKNPGSKANEILISNNIIS